MWGCPDRVEDVADDIGDDPRDVHDAGEHGDVRVAEHEGDGLVLEAEHVGHGRVEDFAGYRGDGLGDVHDAGGHGDVRVAEHEGDDLV